MASTPEEKPQRATAAQLANRKIKDARRRRPGSSAPSFGHPQPSAPFSSIDPNIVSSNSTPQQPPPTNGLSAVESQSFPGAGPPNQSSQGSTPFAFGAAPGGQSFNFTSAPAPSNPFANMDTTPNQQPSGNGFAGFQGNMFNIAPAGQAPNQQPLPSTGLFGSNPSTAGGMATNSGPPGSVKPSTPASTFGEGSSLKPATPLPAFGQSGAFGTPPASNIFGQSTTNKSPLFGQSPFGGGDSMHTSPDTQDAKSAEKTSSFSAAPKFNFGTPTSFGSPAAGFTFGGTSSSAKPAFGAGQTPAKPLFGVNPAPQSTPSSGSIFGATNLSTAATPSISAPAASTQFGAPSPTKAAANPFQPSNLFATSSNAVKEPEEKPKTDNTSADPRLRATPSTPSSVSKDSEEEQKTDNISTDPRLRHRRPQFNPLATAGPSDFTKSESAAPAATSGGIFGGTPAFGASQPSSTGNLFAPKLAATAEQAQTKPDPAKPFGNLFSPKPATPSQSEAPSQPAAHEEPAKSIPKPAQNPFGSVFANKPATPSKPAEDKLQSGLFTVKPSTPTENAKQNAQSAEPPETPNPFAPKATAVSAAEKSQALAETPAAEKAQTSTETPATVQKSTQSAEVSAAIKRDPALGLANLGPRKIPPNLSPEQEEDYKLLYKIRTLNDSLKREINKLDPAEDDFDRLLQFYIRVRNTLGIPLGFKKNKGKAPERAASHGETTDVGEGPSQKTSKPSGDLTGNIPSSSIPAVKETVGAAGASAMTIAPSSITSTPSKLFGEKPTPTGQKRKSIDEGDDEPSSAHRGKRTKDTVSTFAESFTNSRSTEMGHESPSSPFKSSTPGTSGSTVPSMSTTPASSPAKPLFQTSSTGPSASVFSQSALKPASGTAASGDVPSPAAKTTEPKTGEHSTAPALQIPKFGSAATSGTDFMSQFRKQADQDAAKEKAKRKADEFDSDEDDEAEWERKDAEEQRKKRQQIESLSSLRPKFVPGRGFVFPDGSSEPAEPKPKPAEPSPAPALQIPKFGSATGGTDFMSQFKKQADQDAAKEKLKRKADDFDSDEDDEAEWERKDAEEQRKKRQHIESLSQKRSKFVPGKGFVFEDDNEAAAPEKAEQCSSLASDAGKSVFESKSSALPKGNNIFGHLSTTPSEEADTDEVSSKDGEGGSAQTETSDDGDFAKALAKSKRASTDKSEPAESGSATPSSGRSLFDRVQTPNEFGQSSQPSFGNGGSFASSTGSIFAASQTSFPKPGSGEPIKFGTDQESGPATPKPFSTLFGAKDDSAAGKAPFSTPKTGFAFGVPTPQAPSLTPTFKPDVASGSTTPGVTPDTEAKSDDGEAAEALPQADFISDRPGEENEDVLMETRARGLLLRGTLWESQAIGCVRILKNRTTSRTRILLRADPSGKVALNTFLVKAVEYKVEGTSVKFAVPMKEGAPQQWAIRVTRDAVKRLASLMEENKA